MIQMKRFAWETGVACDGRKRERASSRWVEMVALASLRGSSPYHLLRSRTRWTCCSQVDVRHPSPGARDHRQTLIGTARVKPAKHDCAVAAARSEVAWVARMKEAAAEGREMELQIVQYRQAFSCSRVAIGGVLPAYACGGLLPSSDRRREASYGYCDCLGPLCEVDIDGGGGGPEGE